MSENKDEQIIESENVLSINDTITSISSNIGKQATLNFFTNPSYMNRINKFSNNKSNKKLNEENIKFYKKRIVSLFKDILKDNEPSNCSNDIKHIHDLFVSASIKYFEMIDKRDIIQGNQGGDNNVCDMSNNVLNENMEHIESSNIHSIDDANSIMMRKKVEISNLDNYIINNTPSDGSSDIKKIIPVKLDIDLKNPSLRTKGVKSKKVNNNIKKSKGISETSISETSISEASISETSISETSISEASISETSISEASISEASISEKDLSH